MAIGCFGVSSAKASAFRRFLSRYATSNRIDAEALARLPLVDPGGLVALELPDDDAPRLRRRARSADRLVEEMTTRKQRTRDLARQCYPMLTLLLRGRWPGESG